MPSTSKYLPFILAGLALATLAGACTLSALGVADAQKAWTGFFAVAGVLIGVHINPPASP